MKLRNMWPHLLSILFNSCVIEAYPVFTFDSTPSPEENAPSYAYLVTDVQLPENFIFCSSIKQARFDDVGFFIVNGKDSQEWLEMEFESFSKETKLTVRRGKHIHRIGELQNPTLNYWYHICLRLDVKKSEIEVAVNGKRLGNASINVTNVPSKLSMKIGVGHYNKKQFQGSVANIQIFNEGNVAAISRSPCKSWPSTLLAWDPKSWKVNGSDWVLTEEFGEIFCDISDNYNLAIQTWLTIHESLDICKHKLNNSIIPFEEDQNLFFKYIEWHVNTTGGTCIDIWTPFSDKETERVFLNMNDNTRKELHLWDEIEPNGGRDENFVAISVARKALVDVPEQTRGCSSCSVSNSLLLKLDGLCKDSMIGKIQPKFDNYVSNFKFQTSTTRS